MRLRLRLSSEPLPLGLCGLLAGFCWGVIAGMVGLRILEQWW